MKYCDYCLNHGFRFYDGKSHRDNCSLRRCACVKCGQVPPEQSDEGLEPSVATTSTHNQSVDEMTDQIMTFTPNEETSVSVSDDFDLMSARFEEVRSLAQELSESDISEKDLQTCVLYALLESNDFSVTETRKQLCQSRTAIAESLVLPAFNINRELNLKRPRTSSKESTVDPNRWTKGSIEMLCSLKTKAKKSFPRKNYTHANNCQPKASATFSSATSSTVQTNQSEDVLTRKVPNLSKGVTDPTQSTGETTNTEMQTTVVSPLKISSNYTLLSATKVVDTALNKTYIFKPFVKPANVVPTDSVIAQVVTKKPIQSVRPLSTNSAAPTKLVSVNSSPIVSHQPIVSSTVSSNPSPSLETSQNLTISSANFYSQKTVTKNGTKSQQNIPNYVHNSVNPKYSAKNRCKIVESADNDLIDIFGAHNNPDVSQCLSNLGPQIKTYSKLTPTKSEESGGVEGEPSPVSLVIDNIETDAEPIEPKRTKLCAKVITTEAANAALAALSAIPTTSPLIESREESPAVTPVAQCSSNLSPDLTNNKVLAIDVGFSAKKARVETSYSNQFKLFLSNLKNSALNMTEKNTNNGNKSSNALNNSKEIVEITID